MVLIKRKIAAILLSVTVVAVAAPASPTIAEITGPARVIDGDTIEIADQRIRLHGIDAPELDQTCKVDDRIIQCGEIAKAALMDLVFLSAVTCKAEAEDRYGRIVATCYVGGFDLGRIIVERGWALAYRRYSTRYVQIEAEAEQAGRGMWQGEFVPPWEWRRGER